MSCDGGWPSVGGVYTELQVPESMARGSPSPTAGWRGGYYSNSSWLLRRNGVKKITVRAKVAQFRGGLIIPGEKTKTSTKQHRIFKDRWCLSVTAVIMLQNQYKLDDGKSISMDCFPIRKIFKGGYQSAGHWVKAQKSTKEKAFHVIIGPKLIQSVDPQSAPVDTAQQSDKSSKPTKEKVLDGDFLKRLHCVDNYSDLCTVNISDQNLHSVKQEDLKLFDSVVYVNAAENHLPLEPFKLFPAIRELDLTMNGLQKVQLISDDFPHLEVLNLSYNKLSNTDILTLGLIPQLKILHLTGNNLDSFPPDLTIPCDALDRLKNPLPRFSALEVLMLDDNRLSDPCVFSSLANLHSLKYLNLDKNNFTGVPYLQQMALSLLERTEDDPLCQSIVNQFKQPIQCPKGEEMETNEFQSDIEASKEKLKITETEEKTVEEIGEKTEEWENNVTDVTFTHSDSESNIPFPIMQGQESLAALLQPPKIKPMCFLKQKNEFLPPFSGLRHLSLAKNKITDDEELLAVCLFPALNKLTIYKNPVACYSGFQPGSPSHQPSPRHHFIFPVVKHLLVLSMFQDRLGIEVIRSKPRPPGKPPVCNIFNHKRKVNSLIPRIPKQVPMLEAAEQLLELDQAREEESQSDDGEMETPTPPLDICSELLSSLSRRVCTLESRSSEESSWTSDETIKEKETEGFFMTQVDDVTLNSDGLETTEEAITVASSCTSNLPEKYKGYEEILDANPDPDFVEPVGIQQNVQQLEHSLRKLQLYPDAFARVNLQREPYVPKARMPRKLAEFSSHKSRADKMEEILKRMKEQRAMSIIPLAHVLRGKGISKQDYEEAVHLLRGLQLKYKEARKQLAINYSKLQSECVKTDHNEEQSDISHKLSGDQSEPNNS
ncbi:X-ray radiation resistance-associated protein 1 [Stegostoma tigrinum]|uniref:X-ray radiation resistance-associated protein 1 n=1 Tax=Stegostoma tigrinum TaxID=3053191 RepID=UPI0028703F1C|nr:X-ray radiation resistance-associated protein 1 [Stegostoma tigrinum]